MGIIQTKPSRLRKDALPKRNLVTKESEAVVNYDDLSLLSISAAARLLKVRKSRIRELVDNCEIKVIDFSGSIRIPYFELRRCLESLCRIAPANSNLIKAPELKTKVNTTPQDIMDGIRKSRAKDE